MTFSNSEITKKGSASAQAASGFGTFGALEVSVGAGSGVKAERDEGLHCGKTSFIGGKKQTKAQLLKCRQQLAKEREKSSRLCGAELAVPYCLRSTRVVEFQAVEK